MTVSAANRSITSSAHPQNKCIGVRGGPASPL
jgi:hypothetical protein